jgi:hypothetical protein
MPIFLSLFINLMHLLRYLIMCVRAYPETDKVKKM